MLVFLPGVGEIRRLAGMLEGQLPEDVIPAPLYGDLSPAEQDRAIAPAPEGRRKLVLATDIAQTSLTIEGIRVVVDAGLERRPAFDPVSGMTRLETVGVSRASADQRAGRAGRLAPGVCYRLWAESERLPAFSPPEIRRADLSGLVLELACWGCLDASHLDWLDPPPAAAWSQARELLQSLDALDRDGRITDPGRAMLRLPLPPRLAHMLVRGRAAGRGRLAAELAVLLNDRDPLGREAGSDIHRRVEALRRGHFRRLSADVRALTRKQDDDTDMSPDRIGRLLLLAWPDRVARRRPGASPRFQLSNGRGGWLPEDDPLAAEPWLVAAALDGKKTEARIFLAAPVLPADVESLLAGHIEEQERLEWDNAADAVVASCERRPAVHWRSPAIW